MPPFRFDWTVSGGHVVWFLTVLAIGVGVLLALQGNNRSSIADLQRVQGLNSNKIEQLSRQFSDLRQSDFAFQAEQRQTLLELSKTLTEIRLNQVRKHK